MKQDLIKCLCLREVSEMKHSQTDNAITSHLENHQHYISKEILDLQKEDSLTSYRIPPCEHRKEHIFNF